MAPGWPVDVNLAARHVSANPMDPRQVPFDLKSLVAGVTRNSKHLGERNLAVAVKNLELLDLRQRLITGPIGREPLDFDRDFGLAKITNAKSHIIGAGGTEDRAFTKFYQS